MKRFSAVLTAAILFITLRAYSAPAGPGVQRPGGPTCRLNIPEAQKRAAALQAAQQKGIPLAPPAKSNPHVIVLRVSFQDQEMNKDLPATAALFERMRAFYQESSYGIFAPTFTISNLGNGSKGEYKLSGTRNDYGADVGNDVAANDQRMFDDTKATAQNDFDFTQFDHIMLYHSGNGQETSQIEGDIWSVYIQETQSVDGKNFPGFTVVPETEAGFDPFGVICHEYGHQLGLPDLYDTSIGRSTVGAWDLMDYPYTGAVTQNGSNPSHLGAWSKKFLGFGTFGNAPESLSLDPAETAGNSFGIIPVPSGNGLEYFLIEYRHKSSSATFDKGIPMSGLVVWHIDDSIALDSFILSRNYVNAPSLSGRGHRGVDLVEADGTEPNTSLIIPDLGEGNAYSDGQTFTVPQSNAFDGTPTSITITNIAGVGSARISASLISFKASSTLTVLKSINYPNPGGDAGKYPVRPGAPSGTVTTMHLQLSKPLPSSQMELDIYTLNGDRVRSLAGSELSLKIGVGEPSLDNKWVYEYDWDGRNDAGDAVAPGVYLYRFKAESELAVGKMMIVR